MSRKALVTGGAGFIGANLVSRLAVQGWEVIVVDSLVEGHQANLRLLEVDVDVVIRDVADKDGMKPLAGESFDVIFHLAAQANVAASTRDPREDFRTNVLGTLNVLDFARCGDVPKLVFPSTVSVYEKDAHMPISEDAPTRASSPYGAAKAAAENYCFAYADSYGLDVTVLRLFNVYGPLMSKYVIHDFVRKLQRNPRRLVILGDGNQIRDYLYVDDAVDAFLMAAELGAAGGVYNVGSGVPVCIRDLAYEIIAIMELDEVEVEFTMETWPGDIAAWYADISRIRELGFRPKTSWKEGLMSTVEFLVNYPHGVASEV